jgi:radical SAM superfamily enzyme YgiQ (UPF0313 family)
MSRILYLPNSYSQQRQHEKKANIYPVRLASEAEWYRKQGYDVDWGNAIGRYDRIISEPEGLPFLSLPHPDRVFTRAKDYTSGNYKYLPGTHIMSASGCWWGKCSFCVENGKPYEVREPQDISFELWECYYQGYKEVFDDAATWNSEDRHWWWEMVNKIGDLYKRTGMRFSCNYRMVDDNYEYMRVCGFRMLLFGLESANQFILDRVQKGVRVEDIIPTIKKAAEAGLEPHICVVFGWEWETDSDALNTLKLVHYLLRKGYAKTAQASFICQQGIKGNESQRHFIRDIYGVWKYPEFWFHQIKDIKNKDDLKYLWRKIKEGLSYE